MTRPVAISYLDWTSRGPAGVLTVAQEVHSAVSAAVITVSAAALRDREACFDMPTGSA